MPSSISLPLSHGRQRGLSLLELLAALAILALLSSFSLTLWPAVEHSLDLARVRSLEGLLSLARSAAVQRAEVVTLCGSLDGRHCSASWSGDFQVLVFVDDNHNRRLDEGEELLAADNLVGGRWQWRGSGLRGYMRYGAVGQALDFGSFYLCPGPGADRGHRLRVSAPGRSHRNVLPREELEAEGLCPPR